MQRPRKDLTTEWDRSHGAGELQSPPKTGDFGRGIGGRGMGTKTGFDSAVFHSTANGY